MLNDAPLFVSKTPVRRRAICRIGVGAGSARFDMIGNDDQALLWPRDTGVAEHNLGPARRCGNGIRCLLPGQDERLRWNDHQTGIVDRTMIVRGVSRPQAFLELPNAIVIHVRLLVS